MVRVKLARGRKAGQGQAGCTEVLLEHDAAHPAMRGFSSFCKLKPVNLSTPNNPFSLSSHMISLGVCVKQRRGVTQVRSPPAQGVAQMRGVTLVSTPLKKKVRLHICVQLFGANNVMVAHSCLAGCSGKL